MTLISTEESIISTASKCRIKFLLTVIHSHFSSFGVMATLIVISLELFSNLCNPFKIQKMNFYFS